MILVGEENFFFPMFELKKLGGNISRCDERVSGGDLISLPVGLFLASKSSTGPLFPLPFGPASLIPLGLIFPRIGKMFSVLQVCFWIKEALGHFFPLRTNAF